MVRYDVALPVTASPTDGTISFSAVQLYILFPVLCTFVSSNICPALVLPSGNSHWYAPAIGLLVVLHSILKAVPEITVTEPLEATSLLLITKVGAFGGSIMGGN